MKGLDIRFLKAPHLLKGAIKEMANQVSIGRMKPLPGLHIDLAILKLIIRSLMKSTK